MSRTGNVGAAGRSDHYFYETSALTLVTDPSHPLYDERVHLPLDEDLVASVAAYGVLEPILVRKNGETRNGQPIMEIVDGRQRYRAVVEANRRALEVGGKGVDPIRVPAVVKRADGAIAETIMIATGVRVEDSPMLRARKLRRYLDHGHTEDEARVAFGLDARALRSLLSLTSCSTKVQKAVEQGRCSLVVARDLAVLPEQEQDGKLAELEEKGLLGPRSPEAREEVRAQRGQRGRQRKAPEHRCRAGKAVGALAEVMSNKRLDPRQKGFLAALQWVLGSEEALEDIVRPQWAEEARNGEVTDAAE